MRTCRVINLRTSGQLTSYPTAWLYQKLAMEDCWRRKKAEQPTDDALIVVEHPSTYTLGRGATLDNIKFPTSGSQSPMLYRVERGGEVTWHGPGQLVVYPVFDLHMHKKDLHWFASSLEQCVIDALAGYGVQAGRSPVNTGVWVDGNKICALGVTASRWITMHGIAVNLNTDLSHFQKIVPCGIQPERGGVCRLRDLCGHEVDIADFTQKLISSFGSVFKQQYVVEQNPFEYLEKLKTLYPEVAGTQLQPIQSGEI